MRCETKRTGERLSLLVSSQIPGRQVGLRKGKPSVIEFDLGSRNDCV